MKLCKSPEEQLYQQHEHEPIRLWRSQARTQPRRCCGNGSACTQSSEEGQRFKILHYVTVKTPCLIKMEEGP